MSAFEPTLRAARDGDFDDLERLFRDKSVMAQTSQIPYRNADFWRELYGRHGRDVTQVVALDAQRVIAHLGVVTDARPRRRHAAWLAIAVHVDYQGRGVGTALMHEAVDLADNWLNLIRLELGVFADNTRAIALYERFGFVHEGRARMDTFKNGAYVDLLRMARFHPDLDTQ